MRYIKPQLLDDERRRLLDACKISRNPDLYPAVMLALSTGARRMEILGLRWGNDDLKAGLLVIPQTKNGEIALPALWLLPVFHLFSLPSCWGIGHWQCRTRNDKSLSVIKNGERVNGP